MKFELATDVDKLSIIDIYKSLHDTPGWNDIPDYVEDYPSIKDVENDIESHSLYCIKDDSNIVVAVVSIVGNSEYNNLTCWNSDVKSWCDFMRIGVSKNHQRMGLGKLLISYAIEEATRLGYDGIRLVTAKNNAPANGLYNNMNFKYKGDVEEYGIICSAYEFIL